MGIRELREKYGATKPRQAINRAIRAEIPGGAEVVDLIGLLKESRFSELKEIRSLVLQSHAAMSDEIADRYGLKSSKENEEKS